MNDAQLALAQHLPDALPPGNRGEELDASVNELLARLEQLEELLADELAGDEPPPAGSLASLEEDELDRALIEARLLHEEAATTFDRSPARPRRPEYGDAEYSAAGVPLPPGFLLSVVIPVYNERQTIAELVGRVRQLALPLEIIVVDDGSTDGTRHVLAQLEGDDLRAILKPRNEGKGAALRTGFAEATGDIVVVQDADLEYDPRDIPNLLPPLLRGEAEVVYGSRFLSRAAQNSSQLHRWGNRLLTAASNLMTGLRLTDMETCYKAIRRDVLEQIPLAQDRFGFEPEITAKIARRGLRVVERPIAYRARSWREGKKIGVKDAVEALWCVWRYRLRD